MAAFTETVRERKKGFVRIKQGLREVDTAVEKAQRFVERKLRLKRNVIESTDLESVLAFLKAIDTALRAVIKIIETIKGIF